MPFVKSTPIPLTLPERLFAEFNSRIIHPLRKRLHFRRVVGVGRNAPDIAGKKEKLARHVAEESGKFRGGRSRADSKFHDVAHGLRACMQNAGGVTRK